MGSKSRMVDLADIHAAIAKLETDVASGSLSSEEATKRISDSKRAVTPRDLWKASDGRAGAKSRGDWPDIRKTVFAVVLILVLVAVGVWVVTLLTGVAVDTGIVPGSGPSLPKPSG